MKNRREGVELMQNELSPGAEMQWERHAVPEGGKTGEAYPILEEPFKKPPSPQPVVWEFFSSFSRNCLSLMSLVSEMANFKKPRLAGVPATRSQPTSYLHVLNINEMGCV